jgi:hypothetical protein
MVMRCGNNTPRSEWTEEERKIVADFEKFLRLSYKSDEGTISEEDAVWLREYRQANSAEQGASRLSAIAARELKKGNTIE